MSFQKSCNRILPRIILKDRHLDYYLRDSANDRTALAVRSLMAVSRRDTDNYLLTLLFPQYYYLAACCAALSEVSFNPCNFLSFAHA